MKNLSSLFFILTLPLLACCTAGHEAPAVMPSPGSVVVDVVDAESLSTRAYTDVLYYEKSVRSVQILVFDQDGVVDGYVSVASQLTGIEVTCTCGSRSVWAVVNGPDLSSVSSESQLRDFQVPLDCNGASVSKGMVMTGRADAAVGLSSPASVTVEVSRLVSRVALVKVVNALPSGYGAMTVRSVMLTNVVGMQDIAADAPASGWLNQAGRVADAASASDIIDGSSRKASCEDLTYRAVGESVAVGASYVPSSPVPLYAYPNATVTDMFGWVSPFTARKTRIVVTAEIMGTVCYYVVTLDSLERNKAYDLALTVSRLGSDDPDEVVGKGAVTADITVADWIPGSSYVETI